MMLQDAGMRTRGNTWTRARREEDKGLCEFYDGNDELNEGVALGFSNRSFEW